MSTPDPIRLRDGSETLDPRLDRLVHFDDRSREYPIRALLDENRQPTSKWWGHTAKLDQGTEGACVGFAWAHDLAADPVVINDLTDAKAFEIYRAAQKIDEWPGEDYSGTSVLAGAKILQKSGYLDEYRWAFGIDDVILTLSWHGPVILGIPWYYDMYTPDAASRIRPTGHVVGGHAILALAYDHERQEIWLLNSWGANWGWNGLCRISVEDLASLLGQQGEACVPVVRAWGEQGPPVIEPEDVEVEDEVVEPVIEDPEVVDDPDFEPTPDPEDVVIEPEVIDVDSDEPEPEPEPEEPKSKSKKARGYDRKYR